MHGISCRTIGEVSRLRSRKGQSTKVHQTAAHMRLSRRYRRHAPHVAEHVATRDIFRSERRRQRSAHHAAAAGAVSSLIVGY